jgi:glycerophosphoryl diester phosphodiesterase
MSSPKIMAIAHRGASAYAPENTVAAFDEAVRLAAPAVEFDVRLTADGVPVVLHDATLDRTTSGNGPITAHEWNDLLRLDAGSWFHRRFAGTRIPSLEEALIAIGPSALPIIELKALIDPALLESLLQKHQLLDDALVISFDLAPLRAVRLHTPKISLGLLVEEWSPTLIDTALGVDASHLILDTALLGPERIADIESAGLEVWTYTANDVATIAACASLGVTGIITDRPDLIRRT